MILDDESKERAEKLMREKERERNGDHISYPHTPEHRVFADHDGESDTMKLPMKSKKGQSNDRMPTLNNAQEKYSEGYSKSSRNV